jgi:hypothetical protein
MVFDAVRGKWLSVDTVSLAAVAGRNGSTAPGAFYRGADSMVLDSTFRGIPVRKGTLTNLMWTRSDSGPATLEVLVNGVVIASLASSFPGMTMNTALNADFPTGLMSFRNEAGGVTTDDVQISTEYRRRV